jgi:hypothetical protein
MEMAKPHREKNEMDLLPSLEIIRIEENFEFGTFGVLRINKEFFCLTLEPPDQFNQKNISSIPAQHYQIRWHESPRHGKTYIVENVPGRSLILFHKGNWVRDTEGCIILGSTLLKLQNEVSRGGIGNSGNTFRDFMDILAPFARAKLTIYNFL